MFTRNSIVLSNNIKTPLTAISRAIGNILQLTYGQLVKQLFSNQEQGFAYDPNDLTTLYQDAVGNYPVTAAGQPVGLVLDKSKGLTIGAELITNGDFNSGTTGWKSVDGFGVPTNTSMSVLNGVMTCAGTNGVKVQQNKTLTTGKWYKLTCDVVSTDVAISLVAAKGEDLTNMITLAPTIVTTGKRTTYFMATQANIFVGIRANTAGSFSFDNFTLNEIAGNHAYQTVSASRPILQQTPILGNELIVNGDFSNGITNWTVSGCTFTVQNGEGIITATGGVSARIAQTFNTVIGKKYKLSLQTKKLNGINPAVGAWLAPNGANTIYSASSTFVLQTLEFTAAAAAHTINIDMSSIVTAGEVGVVDNVTIKEITGYLTDQNYLAFDGADDFLQTNNIDFTATDKVSLFAGVRKLSDANRAVLVELGTNGVNSFLIQAPTVAGEGNFAFTSGASLLKSDSVGSMVAPISAVLTAKADIQSSYVTLIANGGINTPVISNQGIGNYQNAPIYIGRRAGASLPFSGHLYSLIGIGRLTTDSETAALEKYIAKNTGVTLNV